MSWWFKRHPYLLASECDKLGRNGNYKELARSRENLLVSHGEIILRLTTVSKHPIVIIYPESTPYELPKILFLKGVLSQEKVYSISQKNLGHAVSDLQSEVKFYDYWHQNNDGSLCLLEQDNLETYGEFFSIHDIINRTRDWLAGLQTGKLPPDGPEVEFFAHFRNRDYSYEVLMPESFLSINLVQGEFYCSKVSHVYPLYSGIEIQIYLGLLLEGINEKGVRIDPVENRAGMINMPTGINKPLDLLEKSGIVQSAIDEGSLLFGYWWHIDKSILPIQDISGLANEIGGGSQENGFLRIKQIIGSRINELPKKLVLAVRFLNKRGERQWQCFILQKAEVKYYPVFGSMNIDDYINLFKNYSLQAISTNEYTEKQFHLRNEGLANRDLLKVNSVSIIGCGALGGEIADIMAKAGVGTIGLVDNERLEINNSIRHVLGIDKNGLYKVHALSQHLLFHNFFINVIPFPYNIFQHDIGEYTIESSIGISTIANDNTEGYINEQAIYTNKTIFYSRALRGGKVARIFRVIPGKDACFNCLSIYADENNHIFPKIPQDTELPTITNECNNPIRPASAAELKLISSITARLVLDYIQTGESISNHWIWSTEPLESIQTSQQGIYRLTESHIPPHPKCQYCQPVEKIEVELKKDVLNFMQLEVQEARNVETGGIILGSIENGKLIICAASGPGKNAIKTPTHFLKDKDFCQEYINKAHLKNENDSLYIGEWHYHPKGDNRPSNTDLKSLSNIATSQGYLTENPIMLIFSNTGEISVSIHPINHPFYFTELTLI